MLVQAENLAINATLTRTLIQIPCLGSRLVFHVDVEHFTNLVAVSTLLRVSDVQVKQVVLRDCANTNDLDVGGHLESVGCVAFKLM